MALRLSADQRARIIDLRVHHDYTREAIARTMGLGLSTVAEALYATPDLPATTGHAARAAGSRLAGQTRYDRAAHYLVPVPTLEAYKTTLGRTERAAPVG